MQSSQEQLSIIKPCYWRSKVWLREARLSFLKIEGSLIKQIKEKRVRQIVKRISDIAKDLQLIMVAEFVEDADTADILSDLEIDWGQGYLFGWPVLAK